MPFSVPDVSMMELLLPFHCPFTALSLVQFPYTAVEEVLLPSV
jgi:hypothetical protein